MGNYINIIIKMKYLLLAIVALSLSLTTVTFNPKLLANPTHYGDPKNGCMADEEPVKIQGVTGDVCTPKCKNMACPTDTPKGTTVEPTCALQTSAGDKYCALMCKKFGKSTGDCPSGASCETVQVLFGICTYPTANLRLN